MKHGFNTDSTYYTWGLDLSGSLQGAGGVGGLVLATRDGNSYLPFYDANGNVSEYIHLNNPSWSMADFIVSHYEYDPFVKTVVASGAYGVEPPVKDIPFRFSTKYFDEETGLYYYGYRYYSPNQGRWISRDPLEEDGGVNLYGFVMNNAINRIDYLGLSSDGNKICNTYMMAGHDYEIGAWLDSIEKSLKGKDPSFGTTYGAISCFSAVRNEKIEETWPGHLIKDMPSTPESLWTDTALKAPKDGPKLSEVLRAAINAAKKEATDVKCKAPMCCSSVKIELECSPAMSETMKERLHLDWCNKTQVIKCR